MESPIVTLTTDWGTKDFFVGMMKGRLMSYIPNVQVVDICHDIAPYDLRQAAFVVKNACLDFPPGTIHIIDVDTVETRDNSFLLVEYRKQYYFCADNGLPSAVFGEDYTTVVELRLNQDSNFYSFAAYNLFCEAAALLASGNTPGDLGYTVDKLHPGSTLGYVKQDNSLKVYISYIDHYGNLYLSISYDEFMQICGGRPFVVRINEFSLSEISPSYQGPSGDGHRTEMVLTVSATGCLQVVFQKASAQKLLGKGLMDSITFTFK